MIKKRLAKKEGIILLGAVVLLLVFGILLGGTFLKVAMQLREADVREESSKSFYLAESGIEKAIYELRLTNQWRAKGTTGTYKAIDNQPVYKDPVALTGQIGTYDLQAFSPADTTPPSPATWNGWNYVWVRSDGVSNLSALPNKPNARFRRTICARVIAFKPSDAFQLTLGNILPMAGDTYEGDLLSRAINFPSLLPGETITVNGTVNYMDKYSGLPQPGITITGNGGAPKQSPNITFMGVDLNHFKTQAQTGSAGAFCTGPQPYKLTIGGGGTFNRSTNICGGDTAGNGIVYVEGDVIISGYYDASMLIVATGNITIANDFRSKLPITGTIPAMGAAGNPQIGLFAGQDVKIASAASSSNLYVEAFVMANGGEFIAEGPCNPPGSTNCPPQTNWKSSGTLHFTGAMSARKAQDPNTDAFKLRTYRYRDYHYNQQFKLAPTIPLMPSIANVVSWQEVDPSNATANCPIAALP